MEPQDITVYKGESVQFDCDYTGTFDFPLWFIDGIGYPFNGLPDRCLYRNQILTMVDVELSDSGKTFQCSFIEPSSRIATLTVLIPEGNDVIANVRFRIHL